MSRPEKSDLDKAGEESPQGFFGEMWAFLKHNKKWWLLPIVGVLIILGVLVVLSSVPSLAPFIYTLF